MNFLIISKNLIMNLKLGDAAFLLSGCLRLLFGNQKIILEYYSSLLKVTDKISNLKFNFL